MAKNTKHQERTLGAQAYGKYSRDNPNTLKQNVELVPFQHVITAKVVGTTIDLVESSKNKQIGIQTFDSDKLPANKDFVVSTIKLEYATATADSNNIATADYSVQPPVELLSGEFKLQQGDRGIVMENLVSAMAKAKGVANRTNLDAELVLPQMPIILAESSFEAQIKLAKAITGSADHYVKITMSGYVPKSR